MCKLRRKLLLFDYLIGKLVEWQEAKPFEILTRAEIDKALETMTGTRLMKLLYIMSLMNINRSLENIKQTLFGAFDDYVAMQNGPVEDYVYHNRSILLRFEFESGSLRTSTSFHEHFRFNYPNVEKTTYENTDFHRLPILMELIEHPDNNKVDETNLKEYTAMIDSNIQSLKELKEKFPFSDVKQLIDITHSLPLWNKYINSEDPHYVLNLEDLKTERIYLNQVLNLRDELVN